MTDYVGSFNGLTIGAGTEYPINRIEGIFSRQLDIMTPDLPRSHGGFVGSSYEEPRRIVIEMEVHGDQDDGTFASRRDALMSAFSPMVDTEDEFVIDLPGWSNSRLFYCRPRRGGSVVDVESEMGQADFLFELIASDPAFYSNVEQTLLLSPFASAAGLSYSVTYPKAYGSGGSGGGGQITNEGEWETWPTITISGPSSGTLTNPIIEHVTSGKKLALTANGGVSLTSGQQLVIETKPSKRTIAFATGASRYGRLSDDSDWFALSPGVNELRFRASGATSGAQAEIKARSAWI